MPNQSVEESRFWGRAADQLGPASQGVVSFFLCTPGGRVIPVKDWDLAKALAVWEHLPAAERRPAGPGPARREPAGPEPELLRPPAGGLIFVVSQRALERDLQGKISVPGRTMASNSGIRIPAQPNGDFFWLTEPEWQSLVPASPRPGDRIAVPRPIRERLFRFHLANGAKQLTRPWAREDIRSGAIVLTVEDATPERVRLRLDGAAVLASDADPGRAEFGYMPRLIGLLEYDVRPGRFRRFDFVALGDCWGINQSSAKDQCGPYRYPLGVAVELASGENPAERLPPFWLWRNSNTRSNRAEYLGE